MVLLIKCSSSRSRRRRRRRRSRRRVVVDVDVDHDYKYQHYHDCCHCQLRSCAASLLCLMPCALLSPRQRDRETERERERKTERERQRERQRETQRETQRERHREGRGRGRGRERERERARSHRISSVSTRFPSHGRSFPTTRQLNSRYMVSSNPLESLLRRSTGALQIAASRCSCDFPGFASRPHGSQLTPGRPRQEKWVSGMMPAGSHGLEPNFVRDTAQKHRLSFSGTCPSKVTGT